MHLVACGIGIAVALYRGDPSEETEPPHRRYRAMAEHDTHTVAQIIAQCRRDIEAAWTQVQAARDVLRRSRPLQERWKEQLAAPAVPRTCHLS